MFQLIGTDASCALYIICSKFITSEQVTLCSDYWGLVCCTVAITLVVLLRLALICFWLHLVVQFTSEFSSSCADLCKVSTEDGDHVIS